MFDKELLRLIGKQRRYVVYAVLLMILSMLANVAITAGICRAVYLMLEKRETVAYLFPAAVVMMAAAVRYAAARCSAAFRDMLGRTVKGELRERTYRKILALGTRSTDSMSMAGLTQISLEGTEQLDLYFSSYLPQFFYAMLAPLLLFGICVWVDWRASLVLLACAPLIPLSIIGVSRYAKRIFAKYWGQYTSMGDAFLDSLQGMRELKIFQADAARQIRMNQSAEEFRRITMKVLVMQLSSTTIMDLVAYGGAAAGIAVSLVGLLKGWTTPVSALFVVLIAVEFFLPLRALGSAFHVAMNGASAGRKILALLEKKEPAWGKQEVTHCGLTLRNVTFSYDGTRNVIRNVSMFFPQRGMTAIVGESGCGKSTIVSLLAGTARPVSGTVTVGGAGLDQVSRNSYYARLAVVSYDSYLFNDTVRANFMLACPGVTDERIMQALEQVNLSEFIRENGGPDMVIAEDAGNISGGQKQRLALAVHLVADKDIYLFDEATSNIDVESEAIIMQNIRRMSQSKCVVVISHRLENVIGADCIYYMENGAVREHGTHQELMARRGGYAALYNTQKAWEEGYKNVNSSIQEESR